MPLWGSLDFTSGNNKPKWANTANVYGISISEAQNANNTSKELTPGWVQWTKGPGYVLSAQIANAGQNIVSAGIVTISGGGGSGANVIYGINNISNIVNTVSVVTGGEGYTTMPTILEIANTGVGYNAVVTLTMGGRFNRNTFETLVFIKNMTGDADSTTF